MNQHFVIQIAFNQGHANVCAETIEDVIAKSQSINHRFTKSDSPPIAISKPYECKQLEHGPWDETPPAEFLTLISQRRNKENGRTESLYKS